MDKKDLEIIRKLNEAGIRIKPGLLIVRDDYFALNFAAYNLDKRFDKNKAAFNDRRHTVGETKISYRAINHWGESGLLPDGCKDASGWKKFTLVEVIWLRIIERMRGFGLPLNNIKAVKENIMEWDSKEERYKYFEYYLAEALSTKYDSYIVILSDGVADLASSMELQNTKALLGPKHLLLISLKAVLKEFGFKVPGSSDLIALTDAEKDLLGSIRFENNDEVKAKVAGGEILETEATRVYKDLPKNHEITDEFRKGRLYGRVETNFEDGRSQSVRTTKKRRFKKN